MQKKKRKFNRVVSRRYYDKNKEKILAYSKQYRLTPAGSESERKAKAKRDIKVKTKAGNRIKKCKRCGMEAPAYTFTSTKTLRLHVNCSACRPQIKLEQDQLNRDRASTYYRNNKQMISLTNRCKYRSDPAFNIWVSACNRARKYGIKCTIKYTDVIVPEFCPVLGIKLQCGLKRPTAESPTIDRFNNELGYTPKNIRVISYRANSIKSDATLEEVEKVALYMRGAIP